MMTDEVPDVPYDLTVSRIAIEFLNGLTKPIGFCDLEVQIMGRVGALFPHSVIRPTLDTMIRIGQIKTVGRSSYGDSLLEIPVLDRLANI